MGSQWGRDKGYRMAMREGYRSRAAYKLIEIQQHAGVIREDDNVVDLGAAPGSWLQVIRTLTEGRVLGVDLNPIAPIEGVEMIVGNLADPALQARVKEALGVVNVVVADASPKLSGQRSYDQARAIELERAGARVRLRDPQAGRQLRRQVVPGRGLLGVPGEGPDGVPVREDVPGEGEPEGVARDLRHRQELCRV